MVLNWNTLQYNEVILLLDCEIDASQAIETTSSAPSAYLVTLKSGRSFLVQGDRDDDDEDGDKRWLAPSAYLVTLKSGRAFLVLGDDDRDVAEVGDKRLTDGDDFHCR